MKRILIAFFILIVVAVSAVEAVKNGNDEIYIINPERGTEVSGKFPIKWYMADSDQTSVPFQIDLFKRKCANNGSYLGTIADNDPSLTPNNNEYTYQWATNKRLNGKKVTNGFYCLRICAVFRQNNNYYSLCDKNTIEKVTDTTNSAPTIISTPENTNLKPGDVFDYKVEAEDNDGDTITYILKDSPDFLTINESTGRIRSEELNEVGSFEVTVVARDGEGGRDLQEFTLKVSDEESPYTAEIISPAPGSVLTGAENTIEWTIEPVEGIDSIKLDYSADNETWLTITEVDSTETSYIWDVTDIENGEYYLRLTIASGDSEYTYFANKFSITSEALVITSLLPAPDSKITTRKPEIRIELKLSADATIDTDVLNIRLDGNNEGLDCQVDSANILCTLGEDLSVGEHTVEMTVKDNLGNEVNREWSFEIVEELPTPTPTISPEAGNINILGKSVPRNTLFVGIGILCLAGLLLFIPWFILYSFSNRRREKNLDQDVAGYTQSTNPYDTQNYNPYDSSSNSANTISPDEFSQIGVNYSQPEAQTFSQPEVTYSQPEPVQVDAAAYSVPESFSPAAEVSKPVEQPAQQPQTETAPGGSTNDASAIAMPSAYSDDEIPDWLKDLDSNDKTNNPSAQSPDSSSDMDNGSKVHDSYGLALNTEESDEDSSTGNTY